MIRRLLHRWCTWIAGGLAASIPVVDQLDVYVTTWWADWFDGLWTIIACAALVWLVNAVKKLSAPPNR